ncbi:MAG: HEAT repeat domain-containing protein [Isosphaeraceae bacterium]
MVTAQGDDASQLNGWLALLGGPGYRDREARDWAVAQLRATGADRLFPLLIPMLDDPDPEVRCTACEAVLWVDARRAIDMVLPLLGDPDVTVRLHACGCLHDFGDERAVAALIRVLRGEPDAQVRGNAAYALGGIGSPAAIPALLAAVDSDHELDMHGHSAASCAARALDDILGTEETRIQVSETIFRMRDVAPDMDRLRRLAEKRYEQWSGRRGE